MVKFLMIAGFILVAIGAIWIGQGNGVIGGSFMTGNLLWANIGAATVGLGAFALLLAYAYRRAKR